MKKLHVAVIGAGSRGRAYSRYALQYPDKMQVVAVAGAPRYQERVLAGALLRLLGVQWSRRHRHQDGQPHRPAQAPRSRAQPQQRLLRFGLEATHSDLRAEFLAARYLYQTGRLSLWEAW